MSRIDDLIAELCPDGVEYKALGEVGTLVRGNGLQKKDLIDVGVGAIHYGQVFTTYGTSTATTRSFVAPALAARLRRAKPGDLVIATTSENDEDVCKAVAWMGDSQIAVSGDAYIYSHTLDALYVAYSFQTSDFQDQKSRFVTGTKVRRVSGAHLARIKLPVPPVAVQREIAAILTKMESLEAELETELETELQSRQRQYEHCRGSILAANDDGERVPLGEIATIGTGSHDTKDAEPHGEYVFYARGREPLRLTSFDFDERAIITAGDGVGVGRVFHFATGRYALHQRAYRIVPSEGVDARYVYHYLRADFARYLERTSVHASVTSLRRPMFLKYPISLPRLPEQRRISSTLDRFDALVNDLSIGLPAERDARRKQYAYYRDRLLTFKEAV